MNRNLKTRANNGFTIIELIVVVTVIGLLVAIAVGAYNKGFNDAKITKRLAFVDTLAMAKALFVADPKTTPALISTFNDGANGNFAMIAPYSRNDVYNRFAHSGLNNRHVLQDYNKEHLSPAFLQIDFLSVLETHDHSRPENLSRAVTSRSRNSDPNASESLIL